MYREIYANRLGPLTLVFRTNGIDAFPIHVNVVRTCKTLLESRRKTWGILSKGVA